MIEGRLEMFKFIKAVSETATFRSVSHDRKRNVGPIKIKNLP